jgi:hypothetical protein
MRQTLTLILVIFLVTTAFSTDEPKLTAEDLVSRHLAAIGTPEARTAAKSRGVDGKAHFQFVAGGGGQTDGAIKMGTDGRKLRFVINLNSANYTGEDFVTDGSKVSIASVVSGKRSVLGSFLFNRDTVLKEGLFGGVLSTAWPLLDASVLQPKLKYEGLKRIDGRELQVLKYEPRKNSEGLQIRLYFDPVSFRHVMTVYEAAISVTGAESMTPNFQNHSGITAQEGHQLLRESFGEFKAIDGIVLPSKWTIELIDDVKGTSMMRWDIEIQHAVHAPVDPAAFKMK